MLLFFVLGAPIDAAETNCGNSAAGETAVVTQIFDGDTLRLDDGRHIRVLGINTPELGHGSGPDEPYARAALDATRAFLGATSSGTTSTVALVFDRQREDRYHRQLAHVYRDDGANLESHLLAKGLAFAIAIPPNLSLAPCLSALAQQARQAKVGLWRSAPVDAGALRAGGYQRVRGRVVHVNFAKAWWVELEGGIAAVIYPEHQPYFSREVVAGWTGQVLELQGWVYAAQWRGKRQWRVKLQTPFAVVSGTR
ncbi:MAG: thermonuclease family protein [Porticoccaceae bacterium]